LLLSPHDFHENALRWAEPLGFISLITWEQSFLICIHEDMDLLESLTGEEGATTTFPLLDAWWVSVFNLLLAWEDCTGEWLGES
jgi:hypothetical protein